MTRDELLNKITKMRAHAESTNSESEAMVFADKAARMMAAYEVSEAELAEAETDGRIVLEIVEVKVDSRRNRNSKYGHAHRAASCAGSINALTHTKSVQWGDAQRSVSFMGHKPDVEFATYLYEVIRDAMDREYTNWRNSQVYSVPKSAKGAFQLAMANRINARLYEMARNIKEERQQTAAGGDASAPDFSKPQITDSAADFRAAEQKAAVNASRALVMVDVKKEEVHAAFREAHKRLGRARGFSYTRNSTASAAGREAGNRVGFNRGVGHSSQNRIGG